MQYVLERGLDHGPGCKAYHDMPAESITTAGHEMGTLLHLGSPFPNVASPTYRISSIMQGRGGSDGWGVRLTMAVRAQIQADGARADGDHRAAAPAAAAAHAPGAGLGRSTTQQHRAGGTYHLHHHLPLIVCASEIGFCQLAAVVPARLISRLRYRTVAFEQIFICFTPLQCPPPHTADGVASTLEC